MRGLFVQRSKNRPENSFQVPQNFVVPKSDDTEPLLLKKCRSRRIPGGLDRVLTAVNLDDQSPLHAGKINHVWRQGMLPPELATGQLPITQRTPLQAFRIGHAAAKIARLDCHSRMLAQHPLTPTLSPMGACCIICGL